MCINPWPTRTLHALCSSGPSHYFRKDAVELEEGPGKGKRVMRGEVISIQAMSLLEPGQEVVREMIKVYTLTMPPEVWMGAGYLVAPVLVLEEKQSWFLLASKQTDVVLHTASSRPVELLPRRCGYLKLTGVQGEIGQLGGQEIHCRLLNN